MTLDKVKAGAAATRRSAPAAALGAEIEFFDAGDYPLRLDQAHMDRLIEIYRELKPELRAHAIRWRIHITSIIRQRPPMRRRRGS